LQLEFTMDHVAFSDMYVILDLHQFLGCELPTEVDDLLFSRIWHDLFEHSIESATGHAAFADMLADATVNLLLV
jgi:hypothetical protein